MPGRLFALAVLGSIVAAGAAARAADGPLPRVAPGWRIERIAGAPDLVYPTAVVVAPDGTAYVGQDPMDMPGPPTVPADSIVAIRDGKARVFADGLWAVMGLEWLDGTLYVVHAPFLSALSDTDGDGRADKRVDLVTGLGPDQPAFNGINDHVPSGIRLGMDGFLYIAIGDKGIPRARGADGRTITLLGGGVIRVRPDGTDLEVVSSGERNPLSVALTARDDIFTYGNDDDSKRWPNSLTHHIVGGHYGYPYEFLAAPDRALPVVGGQIGGSGTQGVAYNEDGLPERYRGGLFFGDYGTQSVTFYRVEPQGGTFRLAAKERIVEKGDLPDFRPIGLAVDADRNGLLITDWAFNGWLARGPVTGRLFRLRPENPAPAARPKGDDLAALDHPAHSVRLAAQRALAGRGEEAVGPLRDRLAAPDRPADGRVHALWALDAIGGKPAGVAIASALADRDPGVRLQAARALGIRRRGDASPGLILLLKDADPAVRREAAIALGRIGGAGAVPALFAALGDDDPFAAWSIRGALRRIGSWDEAALAAALADPNRQEEALKLADQTWAVPVVKALAGAIARSADAGWKARAVATLAGLYRRPAAWNGQWFGTNPLAAPPPRPTEAWDPAGMAAVASGLSAALGDREPAVRRAALVGLVALGPDQAIGPIRARLGRETDPTLQSALAESLGLFGDAAAVPALAQMVADPSRPVQVRSAALDALGNLDARPALAARMRLVYDPKAPAALVARALPKLGMSRRLPANDLVGFLDNPSEQVRAAAVAAFPRDRVPLTPDVLEALVARLDDPAAPVRRAAIAATARHQAAGAVPKLIALATAAKGDDAERSEAARALCDLPDPRALDVYLAALAGKNPELRQHAEAALLAIRDQVAPRLAGRVGRREVAGPAAPAVERILARFEPVTAWRAIGPFPRTIGPLFSDPTAINFQAPDTGAEGRAVRWTDRPADPATGRVVLDGLKAGAGERGGFGYDARNSPQLSAFAYAEVTSPRDRAAWLRLGSSGSLRVLVNGEAVLDAIAPAGRPFAIDSDRVRVPLRAGVNRVVVRSSQGLGTWSFSLQVAADDGAGPASPGGAGADSPIEVARAYAMGHDGDPGRGEALFFDGKGIGCVKCHAVGPRGDSTVGPNLAGLASKYDRAEVLRSVINPSARIATGYQPALIARTDGTVVAGVVRAETDAALELVDAEARTIRVPKSEIEDRKVGDVSIMPAGLVDTLTPAELADLAAYLMSLRAAESR